MAKSKKSFMESMDFSKNQKTVTGILIFLIPVIALQFGFQVDDAILQQLISDGFQLVGGAVALYGGFMKLYRATKNVFK